MPYIGKNLVGILKESRKADTMTGDGSDTTLTLTDTPGSSNNVLVFLDGIRQTPVTDYTVSGTTLTFTTAPETGVNVVALTGSASGIDPKDGSVTSSKIVDGVIGNAKIAALSSSKLTGALPAISGANLTNTVTSTGITNVTSDPTISTNPSGGVGTIHLNQNSGEMFVCTDATAGANVWYNVGGGSGDVPIPHRTIAGYASGGAGPNTSLIHRYSFTSDGNATTHGDLTDDKQVLESGSSSTTHGYVAGGMIAAGGNTKINNIDKFAFASNTTATGHGVLTRITNAGASSYSSTDGFHAGGEGPNNTVINKFSFASNTTASSHGNIRGSLAYLAGHSSETHGFISGGGPPDTNQIDKYAFASNTTSADHGDLETAVDHNCGTMSSTDGYTSGGHPETNKIQKFAFSSNTTATDHGNLTRSIRLSCGQSSTTYGYNTGGGEPTYTNVIEKFSFGTSSNATDVGDLTITISYQAGHEE